MNKREIGTRYEAVAAEYLGKNGIKIIKTNYRVRQGEIDLVGIDKDVIVFFEVKYRKNSKVGDPAYSVTKAKQRTICEISQFFLNQNKSYYNMQVRYDVVTICGEIIQWYQNAFDFVGRK